MSADYGKRNALAQSIATRALFHNTGLCEAGPLLVALHVRHNLFETFLRGSVIYMSAVHRHVQQPRTARGGSCKVHVDRR